MVNYPLNNYKQKRKHFQKWHVGMGGSPRAAKQGKSNSAILLQHPYILFQFSNYICMTRQLL